MLMFYILQTNHLIKALSREIKAVLTVWASNKPNTLETLR